MCIARDLFVCESFNVTRVFVKENANKTDKTGVN